MNPKLRNTTTRKLSVHWRLMVLPMCAAGEAIGCTGIQMVGV
jgi:hypothetical protein